VETNQIAAGDIDVNASMLDTLVSQKELLKRNITGEEHRASSERDRLTSLISGLQGETTQIEGQIRLQQERLRVAETDMAAADQLRSRAVISEVDYRRRQVQLLEQKQAVASLK
jgi:hypothetical protein